MSVIPCMPGCCKNVHCRLKLSGENKENKMDAMVKWSGDKQYHPATITGMVCIYICVWYSKTGGGVYIDG